MVESGGTPSNDSPYSEPEAACVTSRYWVPRSTLIQARSATACGAIEAIAASFRSSLETMAPAMRIVGIKEALDKEDVCYQFTKNLIEEHSDPSGIYHFGADMNGIVRAIQEPGYRQ